MNSTDCYIILSFLFFAIVSQDLFAQGQGIGGFEAVDVSYAKDSADFNHVNNYYIPEVNQRYVGWTENDEWVNYTVDAKVGGTYKVDALYADNDSTITFDVDQQLTTTCKLPLETGNYHSWNKAEIGTITFSQTSLIY